MHTAYHGTKFGLQCTQLTQATAKIVGAAVLEDPTSYLT